MLFTFRNFFLQNVCADNWFIAADYSMMAKTGLVHILEVWHMGTFKVLMRKNSERLWYHYFVWITEKVLIHSKTVTKHFKQCSRSEVQPTHPTPPVACFLSILFCHSYPYWQIFTLVLISWCASQWSYKIKIV